MADYFHFWRFVKVLAMVLLAVSAPAIHAQQAGEAPPPPETPQIPPAPEAQSNGYTIHRDVDLVELHVSVVDDYGQFVPGLKEENFRIYEDDAAQKIAVLRQEDMPVSMGLVIDNSGSMDDKRAQVNAAALTFVTTSNPDDEVFVAHFNESYFLDLDKDFTSDISELRKALEHIESRGSTALYDALISSLGHLKSGYHDKKVLLVITDGEDNSSHNSLGETLQAVQKSNAIIYAVGLLRQESEDSAQRAREALTSLTQATGGAAFFPEGVEQVELICAQIARDIRHQYTLAYYPTNAAKDGSFRAVRVTISPPDATEKVSVRTRTGYYAQRAVAGNR